MEIGSIDLTKYQKNDYLEAYIHLRDEKYIKTHIRKVSARVQEIMEGMLYFIDKYSLDVGLVLDPEKVLDHIRGKHPHDYKEIGLLGEILKHTQGDKIRGRLFSARHDLVVARRSLAQANREISQIHSGTETILATLFQGYLVTNIDFMILKTSYEFPPMLGYEAHDLIGKSLYELIPDTHKDMLVPETSQVVRPGSRKYVLEMQKKDGASALVLLYVITVLDFEEGFQQIIVLMADISKKLELVRGIDEVGTAIQLGAERMYAADKKIKDAEQRAAEILRKTQEEKARAEKAERAAMIDGLTGIRNRRAFNAEIQVHFQKVVDSKTLPGLPRMLSLVYFDIDDFKSINDRYGHFIGDAVLGIVGKKLRSLEDESIHAYRIWWEEFAMVGMDMDIEHMKDFSDELRSYFEQEKILVEDRITKEVSITENIHLENKVNLNKKVKLNKKLVVKFTISMGLVEYSGGEFPGFHEMCKTADDYMMLAKRQGKNRVVTSVVK